MTKKELLFLRLANLKFNHSNKLRIWLYKKAGISISEECYINKFFTTSNKLIFGDKVYINRFCRFMGVGHDGCVELGNNVFIAFGVTFCLVNHEVGESNQRAGKYFNKKIHIGDGSWICANATILPGITIGKGFIVAAGAVVSSDCEDNYMYGGCPAKKIKKL